MATVPSTPIYSQPVVNGSTSKSFYLYITDASNLPKTGLAFDTAGLLASYAGTKLARVAITLADLAAITTAWASGGFKEVDATNMPGWYRIDVPNAALALSAAEVVITVYKADTCYGALVIPIPAVTVGTAEAKIDIVDTNVDTLITRTAVDTGTLGDVVDAIADGIPALDVVSTNTSRTDN